MSLLIRLRWIFLTAALLCPLVSIARLYLQGAPSPLDAALWWSVPPLQALGTYAVSRRFKAQVGSDGWAVAIGYASAAAWLIALIAITGPAPEDTTAFPDLSNLALGLQAMALGVLTQMATLIGFALKRA